MSTDAQLNISHGEYAVIRQEQRRQEFAITVLEGRITQLADQADRAFQKNHDAIATLTRRIQVLVTRVGRLSH